MGFRDSGVGGVGGYGAGIKRFRQSSSRIEAKQRTLGRMEQRRREAVVVEARDEAPFGGPGGRPANAPALPLALAAMCARCADAALFKPSHVRGVLQKR